MTKSELILQLSKKYPHLYQRDIETLVNTVFNEISTTLIEGGRVELRGFGAFSVRKREARKARNPKNGQEVYIGERFAIYFRTGKELRERINDAPVRSGSMFGSARNSE
ncbi:MAG: integration host factor subunit beta [Alphaproteobacteria bacterium]